MNTFSLRLGSRSLIIWLKTKSRNKLLRFREIQITDQETINNCELLMQWLVVNCKVLHYTSVPHVVLVLQFLYWRNFWRIFCQHVSDIFAILGFFQLVECNGLSSYKCTGKFQKNTLINANQRVFSGKLTNKRAVNNCQLPHHPQWPSFRKMITKVGCCPLSVRVINSPTIMATKCFGSSP